MHNRQDRLRGGPPREHDGERDKDGYPDGEAGYPDEFAGGNNWQGMPDEKWQYPPPVVPPGKTNRIISFLSV